MRASMPRAVFTLSVLLAGLLTGCGRNEHHDSSSASAQTQPATPTTVGEPTQATPSPAKELAQASTALPGRTRTVTNPDDATMIALYDTLAGIPVPIDEWVEQDPQVRNAQPSDKAARREAVHAEITAGLSSAREIGHIRLSLNGANLSQYDPTYKEFTIGALAPSSQVTYRARGQTVQLQFSNGETAQHWTVSPVAASGIQDRINGSSVTLEVLARVGGVQPGSNGGVLLSTVVHYELRASDGTTLARVDVPAP